LEKADSLSVMCEQIQNEVPGEPVDYSLYIVEETTFDFCFTNYQRTKISINNKPLTFF